MGKKIRTKSSSNKVGEVMEKKDAKIVEAVFLRDRRLTVSVGTSADFGKAKVAFSFSENIKEDGDVMELADTLYDSLVEKLEEKFDDLCERVGIDDAGDEDAGDEDEGDEDEGDEDAGDEDEGDEDEGDEGDEITEEEILKMKKSDLVSLIKEEELDLNIKDYKKIGDLRKAVVDALFEDDGDDDGDWDSDGDDDGDDEWGDDD